ncbi:hypothetical protein ACP70R_008086 [Stipagrostis hirtigluma subsp. patula]
MATPPAGRGPRGAPLLLRRLLARVRPRGGGRRRACLSLRCPDPACSAAVVGDLIDAVARVARIDSVRAVRAPVVLGGERRPDQVVPEPRVRSCHRVHRLRRRLAGRVLRVQTRLPLPLRRGGAPAGVVRHGARAWLAKNVNDSQNAIWLLANTKHCPKCRRPIEKNQGCNHMHCSCCGHHFCWLCLEPAGIGYHYSCESYRPRLDKAGAGGEAPSAEEARARQAKASLDRYLYHYERWAANHASMQKAVADMDELESSGLEKMAAVLDIEVTKLNFLTEAYKQIVDCRRVLRWAHAYGYYLDPERDMKKRDLFDELQKHASSWLERLHGCVEQERVKLCAGEGGAAMNEAYREYKQTVLDLTSATRPYFENLVRAFENDLPELNSET